MELEALIQQGQVLFTRTFTKADGVGRPMATQAIIPTRRKRAARNTFSRTSGLDAGSCAACHNQPVIGGAGDFAANVFVSEGFNQTDFDTTDPQFSNERNTNHLFGSGLVELLAREMSAELHQQRDRALTRARQEGRQVDAHLSAKDVSFGTLKAHADGSLDISGVEGVDSDLIIRPFSHKGVMTSLRQFTVNALNHHHGLQASERFGPRWTGTADHDEDGKIDEIDARAVSALVAWQATLPAPGTNRDLPDDWKRAASKGEVHFRNLSCNGCHLQSLPLDSLVFSDPGPLDAAGTLRSSEVTGLQYDIGLLKWATALPRDNQGRVLIPLFGDLKRHEIADNQVAHLGNELLSQRFVERNVFMTTELWGVGSTAPYGHRGDLPTLTEIISAHGGEARASRDAWLALSDQQQDELIAYLKTLTINP